MIATLAAAAAELEREARTGMIFAWTGCAVITAVVVGLWIAVAADGNDHHCTPMPPQDPPLPKPQESRSFPL